ncbi:hypothetical protein [Saccharopolyspora pogona]|uniref:hypothetical protein n=1 Tax=Saccharopolyspora pogona TaxID=333966 RepID=UPI0021DF9163|nr:hypothetical protein [Saccharopolyspora pogona]
MFVELRLLWEQHGDQVALASALCDIGVTLLAAGRTESAIGYLSEAESMLADESLHELADVTIAHGRALWDSGDAAGARVFSAGRWRR